MTATIRQKGLRCVACQICEKECPPQCIYIVKDTVKKPDYTGKLQFQPKVFDIDISVCMSCQICVEVCPFDAIKMDVEFELSTGDRFGGLLLRQAAAGEVERVLPQDPSDRSRRSGRAARGGEGQGRSQGQGRCRSQSSHGCSQRRHQPLRQPPMPRGRQAAVVASGSSSPSRRSCSGSSSLIWLAQRRDSRSPISRDSSAT